MPSEPLLRKNMPGRRRERGQSLVELALTAPVLVILLIGIVEVGHAFNSYLTVLNAARDAARLGAQTGLDSTAELDQLKSLIAKETERLSPAIPTSCSAGAAGMCITNGTVTGSDPVDKWLNVEVCYDHPLMLGIPLLLEGPLRLCSNTKIRIAI